eukprot:1144491-Pelagomonas_calceolata.AAC.5
MEHGRLTLRSTLRVLSEAARRKECALERKNVCCTGRFWVAVLGNSWVIRANAGTSCQEGNIITGR